MAQKPAPLWFVYMLACTNGKIYTGISTDVEKRFQRHLKGRGAKFTKRNIPSYILGRKECGTRSVAAKLEWQIKRLKAGQKRELALEWNILLPEKTV